jgi:ribosomal protein S12 methylthiotransferase accessory factor
MNGWHTSAYTGLFARFGSMASRPHDPACFLASGEAPSWLARGTLVMGSGIGWTADAADNACLGEAIERLLGAPLPDDGKFTASFADWPLPAPAVDPARWVLFHPEQYRQEGFPFQRFTRATMCDWVCCRQALSGTPVWVPAELAYLDMPGGHRLAPGYSTGLAAGRSGDPLLLRGLQEVIERDAVVGALWGRYAIHEQPMSNVFSLLGEEIRERVVRPNLQYRCLRIASPFTDHVTLVTLEGEDREGYVFSIGSCCRETRTASWSKALLEAIHGRHYVRFLKSQVAAGAMKLGAMPRSFAEHAVWHSVHPGRARLLPSHGIGDDLSPSDSVETIETLIERLGPDRPVLIRSMTPPPLASAGLGWHVLRVMVPGLQPLHGHHAFAHLGGPLWSPRGLADWHAMPPHPFP